MNEHYSYDEVYGTLLNRNKTDTERLYFCIECECYKFYKWMFMYGWNKARDHPCDRNGIRGFEIKIRR